MAKKRVLVVDSMSKIRDYFYDQLSGPFDVDTASSVGRAIKLYNMKEHDLVITKYGFPDGRSALELMIVTMANYLPPPDHIVYMTEVSDPTEARINRETSKQVGGFYTRYVFIRPFDGETLVKCARRLLNKKILIADKDEEVRNQYQRLLSDYDLTLVNDGFDAFNAYLKNDFGLIITSYHLPRKTGLAVVMDIFSVYRDPLSIYNVDRTAPKIIVCSSTPYKRVKDVVLQRGAIEFIRKPIDEDYLVKRVKDILKED